MKICTKCGRELPETEFYTCTRTGKPKATCKDCDRAYAARYYEKHRNHDARRRKKRKKRKEYVRKIKREPVNTKCLTCAYRTTLSTATDVACYYIVVTGKKRPCKAGRGCTVYRKGNPLPVPPSIKGQYKFDDKRTLWSSRASDN